MERSSPKLTVILTHHLDENRKYLDLALMSLANQEGVDFETILVCSSETVPKAADNILVIHDRTLDNATKKVHRAIKLASPTSQHYLFMSDDIILGKNCLKELLNVPVLCILNPMSNSDLSGRFTTRLPIGTTGHLPISADYWEMEPFFQELMNYPGPYSLQVKQDWLSFYCTLMPKVIWEQVGLLDERLEYRHNDQDYCMRAWRMGFPSMINFAAFAFHFGSKTLNKVAPEAIRDQATKVFYEKWGIPTHQ